MPAEWTQVFFKTEEHFEDWTKLFQLKERSEKMRKSRDIKADRTFDYLQQLVQFSTASLQIVQKIAQWSVCCPMVCCPKRYACNFQLTPN